MADSRRIAEPVVQFGRVPVGADQAVAVIAEIGVNHEGDAATCATMIEAARRAGANLVKLQIMDAGANYQPGSKSHELFSKAWIEPEKIAGLSYSCKGRGVCPGCNTRRMVETAAHMVEHVFPAVAVRQWVVVFPKRLRYFMNHAAGCLNRVAGIAMREVQRATAGASTSTAAAGRSGGVLFVHGFGATLNAHVHLHLCMLDGVVAQGR